MNYESKKLHLLTAKAFTLLEILIATAIFSIVMVLTTGVVAQSASYQSKIQVTRQASVESRRLNDLIVRDIRLANTEGTVTANENDGSSHALTYQNGLALFACDSNSCEFRYFYSPIDYSGSSNYSSIQWNDYAANTLLIFYKDSSGNSLYKIYQSLDNNLYFYGAGFDLAVPLNLAGVLSTIQQTGNIINSNSTADHIDVMVRFGGYAPGFCDPCVLSPKSNLLKEQSFVLYDIHTETHNFASLNPTQRSSTDIRSGVTARNYDNNYN